MRQREQLYQRINERTKDMLKHGWIDEVKSLIGTPWEQFLQDKKLIGYDDIITYLKEPNAFANVQELADLIAKKTRNYAKRQICFSKMLIKSLHENEHQNDDCKNSILQIDIDNADYVDSFDLINKYN